MKQAAAPVFLLLMLALCVPWAAADQQSQAIVDAMLGVDPRTRRSSGAGAALDSVYGQPEDSLQPSDAPAPEEWDSQLKYGEAFRGLRSPLFEEDASRDDAVLLEPEEDLDSSFVPVIPLGRPEAREGVMYEDALGQ